MPNIKAMEEYNLTHREKRVILDEVKGLKVCIRKYNKLISVSNTTFGCIKYNYYYIISDI